MREQSGIQTSLERKHWPVHSSCFTQEVGKASLRFSLSQWLFEASTIGPLKIRLPRSVYQIALKSTVDPVIRIQ